MSKGQSKPQPKWSHVKTQLAGFDRQGLLGLIQDLYAANKDNQTFLHTRFGLGDDVLEPYKETIERWLWPDVLRKQDTSVAKAKQAISNYKKAIGEPAGLAELMVFYCEQASGFCSNFGNDDVVYYDALCRMFEQALRIAPELPANSRDPLVARLDDVSRVSHSFGYGVADNMDFLLSDYRSRAGST